MQVNFAFPLVKIGMQSSCSCANSRCVRLVISTCFCFSDRKNCNAGTVVPAAGAFLSNTSLTVFAFLIVNKGVAAAGVSGWSHVCVFTFPLVKIVMWEQLCQQQTLFYLIYL